MKISEYPTITSSQSSSTDKLLINYNNNGTETTGTITVGQLIPIPTPSAADNGKLLQVVEGAAVWTSIADASGVNF